MIHPRILFVDHVGVLGGAELSLLDIARYFRKTSEVVLFEDGPFRERLEEAGVTVRVMTAPATVTSVERGGGLIHDLRAVPGVLRLAWRLARRARSYDVLYANSQKSMIVAAVAGLLSQTPVIWHLRDLMTADHFSAGHRRVTTLLANRLLARIIANSHATRRAFLANGGRAERICTVHNGIDGTPFAEAGMEARDRLRAELGLDGAPVVGVFSRLAHWKGQHVLIEALKDVPKAHALLVGDALFGSEDDYAEALHRQAQRFDMVDRVHFLGFREDVPQLMQAVDAVAHTSTAPEPFGRVIVEGMMAGKPVVATRAGGALELVEDEMTGLLVTPRDSHSLAGALQRLFARPTFAAGLARAGRGAARERFSREKMLEEIERHVRQVVV